MKECVGVQVTTWEIWTGISVWTAKKRTVPRAYGAISLRSRCWPTRLAFCWLICLLLPVDRDILPKKDLWKWQTESEEEEAEEGNEGEAEEGDEGEEEENEEEEETQEDRENLQALIDSVCRN